ncbi:type VI secretion protein [Paraburkholderia monticola]|uniref:Type VI secretion protein n=1 Tax=Paraburkholderia monticola TaxID=1399968 RepID=A0A149PFC1_9BURK|nr:type VI secretion system membrane subunit TssM [Paraburkholderia monticola]KXU83739.1 type VI secretion protein [Paraburkholderia monticola]
MKKIAGSLTPPQWLTLAGVLALLVVVWFEGPLFAFNGHAPLESPRARWIAMALLVAAWVLAWGARAGLARLVNLRFVSGVAGQGQAAGSAELAVLRQRFEQALAILRQARMKGINGRQWVYQLPWYMFIGAPGTGKSTALAHSGLRFPLREKLGDAAIGGVGGTRHCDWWFTDDAVLVDTAGRYTTQDSDAQADGSAWTGFLELLRKYRPRRPLNGLIVTVSAADLVRQDEAARDTHIRTIRSRLTELSERLGVRFPVYVVVTKCDLLAGFTEFFDDLGEAERNQVWGITFPLDESPTAGAALAEFPAEFDALGTRLQARVLHRMQRETDLQRRARLYGFAQQFAGLQPALGSFLDGAFRGTRFEASPLLRGVYFTSGTQHGRPIDRAISAIAQSLGLRSDVAYQRDASGRAYFINRLLKDVVIAEAGLVGANARFEQCRAWLRRGALALVGMTLMLALAGMAVSYQRNRAYVAEFERQTRHVEQLAREANATANPLAVLPLLDAARALPGGYADAGKQVPWLTRLWLYQGDKLGQQARVTYRRLLDQTLLPLALGKLTQELRDGTAENASETEAYRYEALRAYLMLGDAAHFDPAALRAHLVPALAGNASPAQRSALDAHLAALFDRTQFDPSLPLDSALIKAARARLAELPLSQRIGNRVDGELAQANLPAFNLSTAAGPNAPLLLRRASGAPLTAGVAGAYTRAGYAQYTRAREAALADVAKDAWVLGRDDVALTPEGIAALRAALDERYFDAYIHAWDGLLDDVTIVPVNGLADGARVANGLSAPDSPLRKLIVAAARETTLAANGSGKQDATTRVDEHFQPLHELAGKPGDAAALERDLAPLKDAAVYLDAADAARRMGQPAPAGDALGKLRLASQTAGAPLTPVAASLATAGTALMEGGERARLDAQWNASAGPLCRRALDGRYPFVHGSTRDVAADDFGKLFAPGGLIDDFFQKNLATLVDTSGPVWQWRAGTPPAGMSRDALAQFQRAAQIRDAFFHDGSRDMSIRFRVKALSLDPAVTQVNLDIDGQQLALRQDGLQSMLLQWPSGKNTGRAAAQFDPPAAAQTAPLDASGPWALLHLIDTGRLEGTAQPDRYRLTLDSAGRKAVLELDATSVVNPFRRAPLEQFRCPEHL